MWSHLLCFLTFLHCILAGDSAWGNWPGTNTVVTVMSSIVSTSISTATVVSIETTTAPGGSPVTLTVSQTTTLPVTLYTTIPTTFTTTVVSISVSVSTGNSNITTTTTTAPVSAYTTTVLSTITETLNNGKTTTITAEVIQTIFSNTTGFDSKLIETHTSTNRVLIAAIAIAVIVGFIFVVLLALCLVCCCIRRRRRNNGEGEDHTTVNNFLGGMMGGHWGGGGGGGKHGSGGDHSDTSTQMSQTNISVNGGNAGRNTGGAVTGATVGALAGAGAVGGAGGGGARGATNVRESTTEIDERRTTMITIQNVQELNLFGVNGEVGQRLSNVSDVRYSLNANQVMDMIYEADLGVRMRENQRYSREVENDIGRCRLHGHSRCSCRSSQRDRHVARYSGSGRSRRRSANSEDVERQDRYRDWVYQEREEIDYTSRPVEVEDKKRQFKRDTIYEDRSKECETEDELITVSSPSTSLRIRGQQTEGEESTAIFKALRSIGDTMDLNETNIHTRSDRLEGEIEEDNIKLGSNWMDVVNGTTAREVGQSQIKEICQVDISTIKVQNDRVNVEEIGSTEVIKDISDMTKINEVRSAEGVINQSAEGYTGQIISTSLTQEPTRALDLEQMLSTRLIRNERETKKQTSITVTDIDDVILESEERQLIKNQQGQSLITRSSEATLTETGQIIQQTDLNGGGGILKSKSITSTMSGFSSSDSTQIGTETYQKQQSQFATSAMTVQEFSNSFATRRYSARGGGGSIFLKSASGGISMTQQNSGTVRVEKPGTMVEVKEVDGRFDELY